MNPKIVTVHDFGAELDEFYVDEALRVNEERLRRAVPPRYADAVVDVPEVDRWVRRVVGAAVHYRRGIVAVLRTGPSLMLLGPTGCGKTHAAYGAIRALAASGLTFNWIFTTAADLYAQLRPRLSVDTEREFLLHARVQLLVLDDLGAAKGSEWVEEVNYRLINYRYERQLPTLITSNVRPRDLAAALGDRVASRLVEMTQRAVLKGPDRRREAS